MAEEKFELRGSLAPGTVLSGYVIEAVLGYGGYGVVYRARHEELRQQVAIKEYLPAELAVREAGTVYPRSEGCREPYEDGKRRFLEEARRIAELKDDPGVVSCTNFFRANGTAYLVMEYIDGLSLSALLQQRESAGRPFAESDLRSVATPLIETLGRLHRAGILHRDIKPSNILVRRADDQPVLIDFGAAKQVTARHSKSTAPLTPGYAAFEQVGEGELGPWTDIYGLGAVLWRMVAGGNRPWEPPNPKLVELRAAALLQGKSDPLPSAAKLGAGRFAAELLAEIDRCLTVAVDQRPRDLKDLKIALQGLERDRVLPSPPSVANPEGGASRKPQKWLLWFLIAGVLAISVQRRVRDWFVTERPDVSTNGAASSQDPVGAGQKHDTGKPDVWTNSFGIEFVRIPAGEFVMGDTGGLAYGNESPTTRVQIGRSFWMGRYEVTQSQWEAVTGGRNPSQFVNCGGECPVENVSWDEVQRFIDLLNRAAGGSKYRLPTEAEWEYAARGGSVADTYAGNLEVLGDRNAPLLDEIAWYGGNSGVDYDGYDCSRWEEKQYQSSRCGPHPVGRKTPNAFGLYDMLGNVLEWVGDRYGEYPGGVLTDPTGPSRGSDRVVRGCGWYFYARFCRSSFRGGNDPGGRLVTLGFRLLRTD